MSALPSPIVIDLNRPICVCGNQMRLFGVEPHPKTHDSGVGLGRVIINSVF